MSTSSRTSSAHLSRGDSLLFGVNAEVVSVLEDSTLWPTRLTEEFWQDAWRALDTRTPAEDRNLPAQSALHHLREVSPLARWIPRYSALVDHEFANEFYPGYRDHTIHTLHVFLLGLYLYETVARLRDAIGRRLASSVAGDRPDYDVFMEWWTLASLWHDTGYPFEATAVITDPQLICRQLDKISASMNDAAFLLGLARIGVDGTPATLRRVYRAGRFYPMSWNSTADLLQSGPIVDLLDDMWHRVGFNNASGASLCGEIDRLTTQAAEGRDPYHDHGLFGALLLGDAAQETTEFLATFYETVSADLPSWERSVDVEGALHAWHTHSELESVVQLAVEAIAYHNLSTDTIAERPLQDILPSGKQRPCPRLEQEPHLFFLALVDTLQDWDRFHFVPNSKEERHQPTIRSDQLLLQGSGDRILVSLPDCPDAPRIVRGLLKGWLDPQSVASLIFGDPRFTREQKVVSGRAPTLSAEGGSARERQRLEAVFGVAAEKARSALIGGDDDAVIQASGLIGDAMRQLEEATKILLLSDIQHLEQFQKDVGVPNLEKIAFALIKKGTRLPLGTVVDDIGDGGFGTVYLVEDANAVPTRHLAFKLFNGNDLSVLEKRRLFRRGYRAMERLGAHPNVVSVLRFSSVPLGFYMDFVPGSNLEDGLRAVWSIHDRLRLAYKVAETLASSHSQGVIHRDVKPSNVLLDSERDGEPVLTDFDLAWIDGRTRNTSAQYATVVALRAQRVMTAFSLQAA